MLPKPHGGVLVNRLQKGEDQERAAEEASRLPRMDLSPELAAEVMNVANGVFSPLEGFMGREDFLSVLATGRLPNGLPWTIPIVLDVSREEAMTIGEKVALFQHGQPFALLEVQEIYGYDKEAVARSVFGTTDPGHPGVGRIGALKELLVGGRVSVFGEKESPFSKYSLKPVETRVLFSLKGWRTVVGFQTRNVPHLGHEYVQKTALTFVDGIFVNPVIGIKKRGDFKDQVILAAYEVLLQHYYLRDRAVMAILETEMRYAGPREAIFHAILRKNFGCTHFIVGRDHAGVGSFYPPYAAQEIFDQYPDLGIIPLFFTAFFACKRCGGVVNEKTCPHGAENRLDFSGTKLRQSILQGGPAADQFVRPEVAEAVRTFQDAFVE
jgi:sulfate adenylyltransferase